MILSAGEADKPIEQPVLQEDDTQQSAAFVRDSQPMNDQGNNFSFVDTRSPINEKIESRTSQAREAV